MTLSWIFAAASIAALGGFLWVNRTGFVGVQAASIALWGTFVVTGMLALLEWTAPPGAPWGVRIGLALGLAIASTLLMLALSGAKRR
jgi:hypothetical protein